MAAYRDWAEETATFASAYLRHVVRHTGNPEDGPWQAHIRRSAVGTDTQPNITAKHD